MKYLILFESFNNLPPDFKKLMDIAKSFDNPKDFDDSLNWNEIGYDRENAFLRERYLRMFKGYNFIETEEGSYYDVDDYVEIYRTGDREIVWGDYVYINYEDAEHAFESGQGDEIYEEEVQYKDLKVAHSGSGEYFYAPTELLIYGDDLYDLWEYVHKK